MNNIKLIEDKNKCCACGSCVIVCSKNAIKLEADRNGFYYPVINNELCIGCGQCRVTCAYQNDIITPNEPIKAYAAQTQNTDHRKSASGGVFASIATNFMKENGIVYGAVLEERDGKLSCFFSKARTIDELDRLLGSKYIHAYMGDIYKSIKNDLVNGEKVIFAGTPCQVAALRAYLKKDYQNMFFIDIICHGVPEETWFQDYIASVEKRKSIKMKRFVFRDKIRGWGYYGRYDYVNKSRRLHSKYFISRESSYYYYFLTTSICRPNCYSCKYACSKRVGDITIGDFWGIEKEHPNEIQKFNFNTAKGSSCILINNANGYLLLDQYGNSLLTIPSTFKQIAKHNEQLNKPSSEGLERAKLLDIYSKNGYRKIDDAFNRKMFLKVRIYKALQFLKLIRQKYNK